MQFVVAHCSYSHSCVDSWHRLVVAVCYLLGIIRDKSRRVDIQHFEMLAFGNYCRYRLHRW